MASDHRPVVLGCFAPNWTDLNENERLRDVDAERQSLGGLFNQHPTFIDYRECLIADYRPLQIALDEHRSRIVAFHFAGHADAQSLTLSAATKSHVSATGFAPLLASLPSLKLVFLNGCGTSPWVNELMSCPGSCLVAVVATHAAIKDDVAQDFAHSFYQQLIQYGQSLEESHRRAAQHVSSKHGSQRLCHDWSTRKGSWTPPPPFDGSQTNEPWILCTRTAADRNLTWEQMMATVHNEQLPYWISRYQQQVQRDWLSKWRVVDQINYEMNGETNDKVVDETREEFILDQGLRWFQPLPFRSASDDLTTCVRDLTRRRRRSGTGISSAGMAGGGAQDEESRAERRWLALDRQQLITGQVTDTQGKSHRLQRLVLSTDAGVGKSSNLEWLQWEINRAATDDLLIGASPLAFVVHLGKLEPEASASPGSDTDWLEMQIVKLWQEQVNPTAGKPLEQIPALTMTRTLRAAGRLVLLIDQLDQAQDTVIQALARVLAQPSWNACRVIIAGRPYALQQNETPLFAVPKYESQRWYFVQIDEFTETQQKEYLGVTAQGNARWELIPADVREILGTPRVLFYIRYKLTDEELKNLRTASDVYEKATRHLIREGLEKSVIARKLGCGKADQRNLDLSAAIDLAYQFLGGLAFLMLFTNHDEEGPNFGTVRGEELRVLKDQLFERLQPTRYTTGGRSEFWLDVDRIRAMNMGVQWGIVDSEMRQELLWRNRSLQEFMVARWLSAYATPNDAAELPLYLPHDPATDAYYWIWRFTSEMPGEAQVRETWLRSIAQLYQPGDGTAAGTRRSTEMIYRSWHRLEGYANKGTEQTQQIAVDIRTKFLAEFASLLTSTDAARRQAAHEITQNFQKIESGTFVMGSPPAQQMMPKEIKDFWTRILKEGKAAIANVASEEEMAQRLSEFIEQRIISPFNFPAGRAGDSDRNWHRNFWPNVIREQDLKKIAETFYSSNETPKTPKRTILEFSLSRYPVLNSWYRLFDPGHGLVHSDYQADYKRISPTIHHPAIFVSWFDAWVFSQWLHWNGESCRLPYEDEWEYACRAGRPSDWWYWWEGGFDGPNERRRTANQPWSTGTTTAPKDWEKKHANEFGLVDMLGNVWEWCEDEYQKEYDRQATRHPSVLRRVGRGGGWDAGAWYCRAAVRSAGVPEYRDDDLGFRLARSSVQPGSDKSSPESARKFS
jgi:formylglycine-generating enzyme required for sulfatase activity